METSNSSFRPGHFTQLVSHLHEFDAERRQEIAELYGAPGAEARQLAEYWVGHPDRVVEVVRRELSSSVEWRILEEGVLEHDLGVVLDWAPSRGRRRVARLGLMDPKLDQTGHVQATMPGAVAAIFADRVRGERGSLPVLLGRRSEEEVRQLARHWNLGDDGSVVEVILRICDHFEREEIVDEILEALPDPNWIGDALMILELGGMCHWQAVYGYDLDENNDEADNVVPLMRAGERRQQRKVAERLLEMGVLHRLEGPEHADGPMVAVPEALWPGLWKLGRRWLMDWSREAVQALRNRSRRGRGGEADLDLQEVLKWWICESETGGLTWETDGSQPRLSAATTDHLREVFDGEIAFEWDDAWELGRELQILGVEAGGEVGTGTEAEGLLDARRERFVGESLLEWALGYSGQGADEGLAEAIGLDESWRGRALSLLRRQGERVPHWMERPGVEPSATGGGWLRHTGSGRDEMVEFETGLVVTFVTMTKVLWLDLLSLLDEGQDVPFDGLVALMQNVAGLSMFGQLRLVLEEQPAPVYLPFQRASMLMDERQRGPFRQWVGEVVDRLLVPLGVASRPDERFVTLETSLLRVEDPPGWPPGQRRTLVSEIFEREVDFEQSPPAKSRLREVATAGGDSDQIISIEEPTARLLEIARGARIESFDGRFLEFQCGDDS